MKTKFNKIAALVLAFALAVTLVPVNTEAATKRKVALYVSQGTTLKAAKGAKWKTSSKKVATVSRKGKVTAKKAGKAVITAKKGKKSWRFTVTVKNPYLARKQAALLQGENETVKMVGATVKSCSSSNTGVAEVTRMKNAVRIRAVGAGGAVVSVKASDGKTYSCSVTVNGSNESEENKEKNTATQAPNTKCREYSDHQWVEVSQGSPKYAFNNAGDHWRVVPYECVKCHETKEEGGQPERCHLVDFVVQAPTCDKDGKKSRKCTVCGAEVAYPADYNTPSGWQRPSLIPKTGHDLEYVYKKQVTVRDDWDLNYDYNNEHGWEGMGERTATCKTCGESFEEVGFDTGVELADGSQAVVWGVWEKGATEILTNEINKYRKGSVDEETGEELDPIIPTEELNSYALFKGAQLRARTLDCVGQQGKGWATMAGFVMTAPVGEKINLVEAFMSHGSSFAYSDLKYSGAAHLRYETEDGGFADTVVVVGDMDDHPRITCKKAGHDIDYAGACHRCGLNNTWSGMEQTDSNFNHYLIDMGPRTDNPYCYWHETFEKWVGAGVHVGTFPRNDHEGLEIDPGGFDIDHDGICDGCGGPMLLRAGVASWNYCNLALFGYGGVAFDDFVSAGNQKGVFRQKTWPLGKCDKSLAEGLFDRTDGKFQKTDE